MGKVREVFVSSPVYRFLVKHPKLLQFARSFKNKSDEILPPNIKIITLTDAIAMTDKWSNKLPSDFDVIVGIPRNGLWIANIIASKLGKPLSTPENLIREEIWTSKEIPVNPHIKKILLVDDTTGTGKAFEKKIKKLQKKFRDHLEIKTASLFIHPQAKSLVDYYFMTTNPNTCFEWDILKSSYGTGKRGKLLSDMDGVLCQNCPMEVDLDETKYLKWLEEVKPYLIPQYTIKGIVTSRLEKYRPQTEAWLKKYDVKYENLYMLDLQDKKDKTFENTIQHKVKIIKMIKPFWFWESDKSEAIAIYNKTRIPVLCVEDMRIYAGSIILKVSEERK